MEERQVGTRYRLIEPLGEGGMGVVWRAHDDLLDRTVAIKEVRYSGVGEARRRELNQRTIREARAAGRLDHPSVIVIHDVIEEDGRPWIVMHLVPSRSLAETIRQDGPLPPERAAAIGGAVLDALRAAHASGVLHRDVKPENVLLAHDGRVVLTDFGIATLEAEQGLTATGGLMGTPAYMPPERLNGLPAGPESDLWSLGATLYAAVEGTPPFRRDSWAATVAAVLRDPPEPPVRAGALAPVIEGLLRREPADRLGAEEAAAMLRAEAADTGPIHPGHTRPVQPAHPGRPRGRQERTDAAARGGGRRWLAVPAAVVVVGALGAGGVALVNQVTATSRPSTAPQPSSGGTSSAPSPSSGGTEQSATPVTPTPAATAAAAPVGWRMVSSKLGGFSIAVPEDWQGEKSADRDSITWTGPGFPGQLVVEWTEDDWRDPVRHWVDVERQILAKSQFTGYTRVGIKALRYQGRPAADWEFTRLRSGTLVHVVNRGFRTADGRPFAIYWESTDARWARDRRYFDLFVRHFRPS